jgi:hypothetical protein
MAHTIFINYRREDSIGIAGRLHDRLTQAFGRKNIFMDVDHIPAGIDFAAHLNSEVTACNLFLVVIGPNWLNAKDESGRRRLWQADDFVAIEIAAALARDIRVIPILVDNTIMPKASELPDQLKPLARRQAIEVRQNQFGRDADALIKRIYEALAASSGIPGRRGVVFASVAAVAGLFLVGWYGVTLISARRSAAPPPTTSAPLTQEKFTVASVPFITERARRELANGYIPKSAYKAFALNINGVVGYSVGQPSEDMAKIAALDQCSRHAEASLGQRKCELYAVGDIVVYPHGPPPMPPAPWVRRDAAIERPFVPKDMPLVRDEGRERLETGYLPLSKSKSIALGPGGHAHWTFGDDSKEESTRRTLEFCGEVAGAPCMIVVVDDVFVITIPRLMNATGFFYAATNSSIADDARDDLARRLNEASSGWNAVAVGTSGHPGLGLKAVSEQDAINDALGNCAKGDSNCHVIAIGPFTVEPK